MAVRWRSGSDVGTSQASLLPLPVFKSPFAMTTASVVSQSHLDACENMIR